MRAFLSQIALGLLLVLRLFAQLFRIFLRPKANKILVVADFAAQGGTRNYLVQLLNFLRRNGCEVVLMLPKKTKDFPLIELPLPPKVIYLPGSFAQRYMRMIDALVFSRAAKVVVSTGEIAGFWETLLLPAPIYYVPHTYPDAALNSIQQKILRWGKRHLTFISVSQFAEKQILEKWGVKGCSVVVPHTAEIPEVKKLFRPQKIITVGHIESWKNPEFWLETISKVVKERDEVEAEWVGEGALEGLVREAAEADEHIKWTRRLAHDEVIAAIAAAKVYFQPSIKESFGMSVLEAMAVGTPVVVSDRGGLPDLVEEGVNGFVVSIDDPTAVAGKIVKLLEDEALWARMSAAAQQSFRDNFSPEIWEQKMRALLNLPKKN